MGRIAEALKRAQQERSQHLQSEGGVAVAEPPADVAAVERRNLVSAALAGGSRIAASTESSIFDAPAPPKPFSIEASPIARETVDGAVLSLHDPGSDIAEKYRSVRTRLLTANPGGSPRVMAITSAQHKDGKTVTTSNLGFCLSELRYLRVALIDLDFRQRGLSRSMGCGSRPGIAEVLRGDKSLAEVCVPCVRDNLYLIPAGDPGKMSPGELLADKYVGGIVKELTERFHYSLIDTPPMNKAADIGLIAPLCHSVLMVVRMNRTPEPLLCRCVRMLQANHVSIAGCILAGHNDANVASSNHDYFQAGT